MSPNQWEAFVYIYSMSCIHPKIMRKISHSLVFIKKIVVFFQDSTKQQLVVMKTARHCPFKPKPQPQPKRTPSQPESRPASLASKKRLSTLSQKPLNASPASWGVGPLPILWAGSRWPLFSPSWMRLSLRSDLWSSWTLRLMDRPLEELLLSSSVKPSQEQLRTSGHCAQVYTNKE